MSAKPPVGFAVPKPVVSWESSNNVNFHGYLKLLAAQQYGYDLHATFPKDGTLPHFSIYYRDGSLQQKQLQISITKGLWGNGFSLNLDAPTIASQWQVIQKCTGIEQATIRAFLVQVEKKHQELNPQKPAKPVNIGYGSALASLPNVTWGGAKRDISDESAFPALKANPKPIAKK